MQCNVCGSHNVWKKGIGHTSNGLHQRYWCLDCHANFYVEMEQEVKKPEPDNKLPHVTKLPSVLLLDIETLPLSAWMWNLYPKYISHDNIIQDWTIVSWSAKWLFDSEMMSDVQTSKEAIERNDKRIVNSIWKLIDKADICVGHNLKKFDLRKLNARFLLQGLKPPSPYQTIDTLIEARKYFSFSSNRLDYISKLFTAKGKIKTDFELWKRCLEGNNDALIEMVTYNKMDVLILEEVYMELRGWIKSHPNMKLYAETEEMVCPNCLSVDLTACGDYITPAGRFDSLRCNHCGAISRMRKSSLTPKERDKLLLSVAR